MEVARHEDLSGLSMFEQVSLGYTYDHFFDSTLKEWILRSPDSQDQLHAGFPMTEEEIESQST